MHTAQRTAASVGTRGGAPTLVRRGAGGEHCVIRPVPVHDAAHCVAGEREVGNARRGGEG
jgi:hypothetical protein